MQILNSILINIQEKRYLKYIKKHKSNIIKAFDEMINNENLYKDFQSLFESQEFMGRIATHDMSKLSEQEFDAYRKNFYPINQKEKEDNKQDFKLA